jgi:hypothetical protein
VIDQVGFEVLTAVSMKMAVFCLPSSGIALMMEAARTSETLVNFYQTTRCYDPEDSDSDRPSLTPIQNKRNKYSKRIGV